MKEAKGERIRRNLARIRTRLEFYWFIGPWFQFIQFEFLWCWLLITQVFSFSFLLRFSCLFLFPDISLSFIYLFIYLSLQHVCVSFFLVLELSRRAFGMVIYDNLSLRESLKTLSALYLPSTQDRTLEEILKPRLKFITQISIVLMIYDNQLSKTLFCCSEEKMLVKLRFAIWKIYMHTDFSHEMFITSNHKVFIEVVHQKGIFIVFTSTIPVAFHLKAFHHNNYFEVFAKIIIPPQYFEAYLYTTIFALQVSQTLEQS